MFIKDAPKNLSKNTSYFLTFLSFHRTHVIAIGGLSIYGHAFADKADPAQDKVS